MKIVTRLYEERHGKPLVSTEYGAFRLLDLKTDEYVYVGSYSPTRLPQFYDTYGDEPISAAAFYGIITGVGGDRFDPYASLTRESAAVILYRASALLGIPDDGTLPSSPADASSVSSWATDAVAWAMRNGIMSGTGGGNFSPQGTYSVEQAVATLMRLYNGV